MKRFRVLVGLLAMIVAGVIGCAWNAEQGGPSTSAPTTWHLPLTSGWVWKCTQGVSGSYSHTGQSTRYDLDLDTPNPPNEAATLYAPVSGVARVHYGHAGFGTHINVDTGDGRYVVLGHMSEVWNTDGDWVDVGEPVGLAGCTGRCTGDHVHVGVHAGDAARTANYGTSVPSTFWASDATLGQTTSRAFATSSAVCGLTAGHLYRSHLPMWNPAASNDASVDTGSGSSGDDDDDDAGGGGGGGGGGSGGSGGDGGNGGGGGAGGVAARELCWQPTGLDDPHEGSLWSWSGGAWQTIAERNGSFTQLCGTVYAATGDTLWVNGQFRASNAPQSPWWICANWGSAGLLVQGRLYVNGLQVGAVPDDNGADGCDARLTVP